MANSLTLSPSSRANTSNQQTIRFREGGTVIVRRALMAGRVATSTEEGRLTNTSPMLDYTRLLVPVDMRHRDDSLGSIKTAVAIAGASGAELVLMTAANPLGKHLTDTPKEQQEIFEAWAGDMAVRYDFAMAPVFRAHDHPQHAILEECRDRNVDLVVMSSHKPRMTDHLFGSHASHIVRDAPCSVMVVR